MTTGERIRHFRKQILKMTQEDFARKINISRSNLGNIEVGTIGLTDRVATDICNAFSVSEVWLRSGEGEICRESESTLFSAFVRQYDLSEKERQAARYLLSDQAHRMLDVELDAEQKGQSAFGSGSSAAKMA